MTVTVYHGTSGYFRSDIEEEGLKSQRHRKHVYVTTDYKRAYDYSFAWTGGILYEAEKEAEDGNYLMPPTYGTIFEYEVPEELLIEDDYNKEGEPNQYKVATALDNKYLKEIHEITFPFMDESLTDEEYNSEILRARAKLVGISQWGED